MARETRRLHALLAFAESVTAATGPVETAVELAHRAADLLTVDAAAVLLARPGASLRAAASANEAGRRLAELELEHAEGPGHDAVRTVARVIATGRHASARWPRLTSATARGGLHAFAAVPLRRRGTAVGALVFAAASLEPLASEDLDVAQALADLASLAIAEARAARRARAVTEQLQTALDARVVIEQAKGVVAQRSQVSIDDAFAGLRRYARGRHQLLTDVARRVVDGELDPVAVVRPTAR